MIHTLAEDGTFSKVLHASGRTETIPTTETIAQGPDRNIASCTVLRVQLHRKRSRNCRSKTQSRMERTLPTC